MVARFLKRLLCLHPPLQELLLLWDLNTVLAALVGPQFKLICVLPIVSQKTTFLIAITSARRV